MSTSPPTRLFLALAVAVGVALVGCAENSDTGIVRVTTRGPALRIVDSTLLAESDSLYIGQPMALSVTPTGSVLVSDGFARRVIRFSRRGEVEQVLGRAGGGPGEFVAPGVSFTLDDTTIVVDDFSSSLLHVFDSRSGVAARQVRHAGNAVSSLVVNDTVWLGVVSMTTRTGIVRWLPRNDELTTLVAIPQVYVDVPDLGATHPISHFERWADTLLVAYSGHHAFYLAVDDGRLFDSLSLPVARRRGVPKNLADVFRRNAAAEEYFQASSLLAGIHRNTDRSTTVAYFDQTLTGRAVDAVGFISVLAADRRTACVDAALPIVEGVVPRITFRGDTLIAIAQRVDGLRARTVLFSLLVDTSACEWVPVSQ